MIDVIMAYGDGKYLIMKDPTKSILRIYDIPWDTFAEEEGEEEDEDDGNQRSGRGGQRGAAECKYASDTEVSDLADPQWDYVHRSRLKYQIPAYMFAFCARRKPPLCVLLRKGGA